MKKKIPEFKSEDKERGFWSGRDSTKYLNWTKAKRVMLPNLKPSLKSISLRLPESMIEELKLLANKKDVPYQSRKYAKNSINLFSHALKCFEITSSKNNLPILSTLSFCS